MLNPLNDLSSDALFMKLTGIETELLHAPIQTDPRMLRSPKYQRQMAIADELWEITKVLAWRGTPLIHPRAISGLMRVTQLIRSRGN